MARAESETGAALGFYAAEQNVKRFIIHAYSDLLIEDLGIAGVDVGHKTAEGDEKDVDETGFRHPSLAMEPLQAGIIQYRIIRRRQKKNHKLAWF